MHKRPSATAIRQAPRRKPSARGFTLIELMIALVVVGILGALAIPSFINQIRKSRRAEAIMELFRVAQAQERVRANSPVYSGNLGSGAASTYPLNFSATANTNTYNMASGYYSITVTGAGAGGYVLTAGAINGMTGDTSCRRLQMTFAAGTITYASYTSSNTLNASAADKACWNRP